MAVSIVMHLTKFCINIQKMSHFTQRIAQKFIKSICVSFMPPFCIYDACFPWAKMKANVFSCTFTVNQSGIIVLCTEPENISYIVWVLVRFNFLLTLSYLARWRSPENLLGFSFSCSSIVTLQMDSWKALTMEEIIWCYIVYWEHLAKGEHVHEC